MDYKERLIQERNELEEKCKKLENMLYKYSDGTLDFNPNCSYELLHEQYVYMMNYLSILSYRVQMEVPYHVI